MIDRLSMVVGQMLAFRLEDLRSDEGQTTVEYAVVLVLVIALAVAAFAALSTGVANFMSGIESQLTSAIPV
jgi:Flp pilus assembly pilin Flp